MTLVSKRITVAACAFNENLLGRTGAVVAELGGRIIVRMDAEYLTPDEAADALAMFDVFETVLPEGIEYDSRLAWFDPANVEVTSC